MASGRGMQLTLTNILILVMMTLVLIQAFGLIVGGDLGESIKLGPIFILVAIAASAFFSISIFKRTTDEGSVLQKRDVLALILVVGIALILLFFLRDFVPEIFTQGLVQIQAFLGF